MYIANKADRGLLNGSSSMEHRRSFCFGYYYKSFSGAKTKASAQYKLDRFVLRNALLAIYSTLATTKRAILQHEINY